MISRLLIVIVALGLLGGPVSAQDTIDRGLKAQVGMFHITDSDARDLMGSGISINLEKMVKSTEKADYYVGIGYSRFSGIGDLEVSLMPIMATWMPKRSSDAYYGVGVGLIFMNADAWDDSASETDFAYRLLAGKNFGEKCFAQVEYLYGGRVGNTGLCLSIGARF